MTWVGPYRMKILLRTGILPYLLVCFLQLEVGGGVWGDESNIKLLFKPKETVELKMGQLLLPVFPLQSMASI